MPFDSDTRWLHTNIMSITVPFTVKKVFRRTSTAKFLFSFSCPLAFPLAPRGDKLFRSLFVAYSLLLSPHLSLGVFGSFSAQQVLLLHFHLNKSNDKHILRELAALNCFRFLSPDKFIIITTLSPGVSRRRADLHSDRPCSLSQLAFLLFFFDALLYPPLPSWAFKPTW